MALSDLQLTNTDKARLYNEVELLASDIAGVANRWREAAEWLNLVSAADAETLGVTAMAPTFAQFRADLNSIVAAIDAAEGTINQLRRMRVN